MYQTDKSFIVSVKEPWLHRVDCSEFVAKITYNLHNKMSISDLQNDRSYPSRVLAKK